MCPLWTCVVCYRAIGSRDTERVTRQPPVYGLTILQSSSSGYVVNNNINPLVDHYYCDNPLVTSIIVFNPLVTSIVVINPLVISIIVINSLVTSIAVINPLVTYYCD